MQPANFLDRPVGLRLLSRLSQKDLGQATLESLFIMFLMFMLIAAIYQMFLIHNAIYQMAANAYYDTFKEARDKNDPNTEFTTDINKPLKLKTGGQTIPTIRFFQSGVSMQVKRKYWIGSGTKGEVFSMPDFGSGTASANQQANNSPPCSGCGCSVDGDPDHTIGSVQLGWIMSNPGVEPSFPHTTYVDAKGNTKYGLKPNCN